MELYESRLNREKSVYNTNCLTFVMKRVSVLCEVRNYVISNFGQSSEISERVYYFSFLVKYFGLSFRKAIRPDAGIAVMATEPALLRRLPSA